MAAGFKFQSNAGNGSQLAGRRVCSLKVLEYPAPEVSSSNYSRSSRQTQHPWEPQNRSVLCVAVRTKNRSLEPRPSAHCRSRCGYLEL